MLRITWFVPPALALAAPQAAIGDTPIRATRTHSSDEQFAALMEGRCDVAVTAMDNVIGWNTRSPDADFRVVAQIETTTPLNLIARPQFSAIEELRGSVLLVDSPENGFVVALLALLDIAGLRREEILLTRAGGVKERLDAMVKGQGDATLLGPPFDGLAQREGMMRLASVNEQFPNFPGQGLVLRRSSLPEIGAETGRWLALLEESRTRAKQAPGLARAAIENTGIAPAAAAAMAEAIPATLEPSREGVELLISQRRMLGLPGADATYSDIVDASLLQDLH